jgi:hypothetical protein
MARADGLDISLQLSRIRKCSTLMSMPFRHNVMGCSKVPARTSCLYLRLLAGSLTLGMAASTSVVATERAAVAALELWSIQAEMAAPS